MFWMLYWIMTGIHAIHLSAGILVVAVVVWLFGRRVIPVQDSTMEGVATYWHFVDTVWLVLYPLLYLEGAYERFSPRRRSALLVVMAESCPGMARACRVVWRGLAWPTCRFGSGNIALNLLIAAVMIVLLVTFLMDLKSAKALIRVVAAAGLLWLILMFTLTFNDYSVGTLFSRSTGAAMWVQRGTPRPRHNRPRCGRWRSSSVARRVDRRSLGEPGGRTRYPLHPRHGADPERALRRRGRGRGFVAVPLGPDDYIELLPTTWRTVDSSASASPGAPTTAPSWNPYHRPTLRINKRGLWESATTPAIAACSTTYCLAAMAECDAVCEHAHLPLQSGSTRVLKAMRRTYGRERYLRLVEEMRAAIPDLALTTDIIVGFPGETEEDFRETLEVVEEVRYDGAFTFVYSPRAGTEAAAMEGKVPDEIKRDRIERLVEVVQRIAREQNEERVGLVEQVLVEGASRTDPALLRGRTRRNTTVNFAGSAEAGNLVDVRIDGATSTTLHGSELAAVAA